MDIGGPDGGSMTARQEPSFDEVNATALAAYPGLLGRWFPQGRREGGEFCIGNLQGEKGQSLRVNVTSGVWKDFEADHGGSDPVSLYAAIRDLLHHPNPSSDKRAMAARVRVEGSGK